MKFLPAICKLAYSKPSSEHRSLKMVCPENFEKASLPNSNLITSALPKVICDHLEVPTSNEFYFDNFWYQVGVIKECPATSFTDYIFINPHDYFLDKCVASKDKAKEHYIERKDGKFPIDILPEPLKNIVKSTTGAYTVTDGSVAMTEFTFLGACIGKGSVLMPNSTYEIYAPLFTLIEGTRGSKKSSIHELIFTPFEELEEKLNDDINSSSNEKAVDKWFHFIVEDFTIPGAGEALKRNKWGIVLYEDEAEKIISGLVDNKIQDMLLKLYNCKNWSYLKKGKGNEVFVKKASGSFMGSITEESLYELYAKKETSGLMDRFFLVRATVDGPIHDHLRVDLSHVVNFNKKCLDNLIDLCGEEPDPEIYTMDDDVYDYYENWMNSNEDIYYGTPYHARFQKAKKQALKIALILHIVNTKVLGILEKDNSKIPLLTMSLACRIMDWIMEEFKQIYNDIKGATDIAFKSMAETRRNLFNVIRSNCYKDKYGSYRISNYDVRIKRLCDNFSTLTKLMEDQGFKNNGSVKQSNGKIGRGYIISDDFVRTYIETRIG